MPTYNPQIFQFVIPWVFIDMVNYFILTQASAQNALSNKAVLAIGIAGT